MSATTQEAIFDFLTREASVILSREQSEIREDASLPSLGFDSLSFVELLVSIERQYQLKAMEVGFTTEDMKTLKSLATGLSRILGA